MGGSVSSMATRDPRGVDVVFEAPRWSERWVLQDGVTMPVTPEHLRTTTLLREVLEAFIARTGLDATAGEDIALRWDESHASVGVDPDVYLVAPALPKAARSILTWEAGHAPPRVAAEVVSRDTAKKDYNEGPLKYAASGTRELWIFDPERRGRGLMGGPWALQVWRRTRTEEFRLEYTGDGPAYSEELGAWLVVTDEGQRPASSPAGATGAPYTSSASELSSGGNGSSVHVVRPSCTSRSGQSVTPSRSVPTTVPRWTSYWLHPRFTAIAANVRRPSRGRWYRQRPDERTSPPASPRCR